MNDQTIASKIEDLLKKMRINVDRVERVESDTYTTFLIHSPDASMLIGNRGENLDALSFVIRRIVERDINEGEDRPVFVVDVNNYQTKKIKELIDSVELSVRRAKLFRQDIELSPMTSYERMIIHSAFSNDPEITTQSEGEGRFRRVVLKYSSQKSSRAYEV